MIFVIGDMHVKKEEPFFSAASSTFDFILSTVNSKDTLIFLGDVFHVSRPYPKSIALVINFLMKLTRMVD